MGSVENELARAIIQWLQYKGAFAWRNNTGMLRDRTNRPVFYGLVGSSDVIGFLPNGARFLAIELKSKKGKTTPSQDVFLEEVTSRGGVALVIREGDDWEAILSAAIGDTL